MEEFKEIEINKIKDLENIRTRIEEKDIQDLMSNINQHGLLQPIGAWESNEEYIIAYGNRRLMACKKLGWKKITAKILGELSTSDMLLINASENIHRKDTTVAELGRITDLLCEQGLSIGEVAVRLSIPKSRVDMAYKLYKNIDREHRGDIVFMRPGTKNKVGKIPASSYNHLFSIR